MFHRNFSLPTLYYLSNDLLKMLDHSQVTELTQKVHLTVTVLHETFKHAFADGHILYMKANMPAHNGERFNNLHDRAGLYRLTTS